MIPCIWKSVQVFWYSKNRDWASRCQSSKAEGFSDCGCFPFVCVGGVHPLLLQFLETAAMLFGTSIHPISTVSDTVLGGRFGYFLFFVRSGRGKREFKAPGMEGGIGFFIENPGREGPRGREGVCGELGNFGRGS